MKDEQGIDVYDTLGIPRPIEPPATSADTAASDDIVGSAEPSTETGDTDGCAELKSVK
jgi:hypothetical protein